MKHHFVYIWFDRHRRMFYIGQHSGLVEDHYISSSKWLNGEVKYRPNDFKRKIVRIFSTKNESQEYEGYLISLIKPNEFGKKYYNRKHGAPHGTIPWNKGKTNVYTPETIMKQSLAKKGQISPTKGRKFPNQTGMNNNMNKPGAKEKLAKKATGRKRHYLSSGKWIWINPTTSVTEQVGTISES